MEKELRGREKRGTRKGKESGGGRGRGWQLVCVDTRNLEKWWRGRGRERGTRKELEGEGGRERGTRKELEREREGEREEDRWYVQAYRDQGCHNCCWWLGTYSYTSSNYQHSLGSNNRLVIISATPTNDSQLALSF